MGRRRIAWTICLLAVWLGPGWGRADETVWNLRTPEWKEALASLPDGDAARLDLIRVASQLVAYSGHFYPVVPVGPSGGAVLPEGYVPVALGWFQEPSGLLAFGIARGWGHLVLGHQPATVPGTPEDAAAWRVDARFNPADEAAADAWAGRFLADFGRDPGTVLAALCGQDVSRADAVADAYATVTGLRPDAPCSAPPLAEVTVSGSCSERYDACYGSMEVELQACQQVCYEEQCALSCSSGSYDQCNSCTSGCAGNCSSAGASSYDACVEERDSCEDEEIGNGRS